MQALSRDSRQSPLLSPRSLLWWAPLLLLGAGCLAGTTPTVARHQAQRPVIAMTGPAPVPGESSPSGRYIVKSAYRDALLAAGGLPIHVVPLPATHLGELLDGVDGVLLTGGLDINPETYGETPHPTVEILPAERQEFDFALAREALHRRIPVLGICLGAQELNVLLGGSLIQDIPSEVEDNVAHRSLDLSSFRRGAHPIALVPGTALAEWYGQPTIRVNSAHHQAVERLGEGLVIAARAPDGVVEAFVHEDYPFLVGVQFHPELQTFPEGLHRPLFRAFVEASAAFRRDRLEHGETRPSPSPSN